MYPQLIKRKEQAIHTSIIAGLTAALSLFTPSVEAGSDSTVPQRFIDRLENLRLYPGHYISEKRSDGERFILVTLPKGESTTTWTNRLIISIEPALEPIPQEGLRGLLASVERPYEESCAIEDRFYEVESLTYMVDDEHPSRSVLTGCSRLQIPGGVVREISYSRLIAGPQGRFTVQWSERTEPSDELSYAEFNQVRERMDGLDPFGGRAVRKSPEQAFEGMLR